MALAEGIAPTDEITDHVPVIDADRRDAVFALDGKRTVAENAVLRYRSIDLPDLCNFFQRQVGNQQAPC